MTVARRNRPGTIEHFMGWARALIMDDGEPWAIEPFQRDIVKDILAGYTEVWVIIPEGNGKTTLLAGVALYHADTVPAASVPIAASSREQAEIMYRQAEGFVLRTPGLQAHYKCQEGYRRIKALRTGGRIQVHAADAGTADGVIPTLALIDELHRHKDLDLYRTWVGKLEKRGGQLVTISTAGEPQSEFEETRGRILTHATSRKIRGQYIRALGPGIVAHDWGVRDPKDAENMAIVAQANPRKALTAKRLAEKRARLTMTPEHWRRLTCNIATRLEGQGVTPEAWDALCETDLKINVSKWAVGFLDLGWEIDCSAVGVLVWESRNRRVVPAPRVLEAPVDEADIVTAILDYHEEYEPVGWVYDPNAGGRQMAQMLEKGTHPLQVERDLPPLVFFEHGQDNAMMSLAATRLHEAIRGRRIVHGGDPTLRTHVLNAVRVELGQEKWKYDRPGKLKGAARRKVPIDALTGLLMGNSYAVSVHDEEIVENPYEKRGLVVIG